MSTIRLRQERINRGWTLEFVALKTGTKKQSVCDWEKCRHIPSYKVLVKLENLFNLSHRELFAQLPDNDILTQDKENVHKNMYHIVSTK